MQTCLPLTILQHILLPALTHHPSKDVALPTVKASDASSTTTQPQPADQPPVLTDEELGPSEPFSSVKKEEVQTDAEPQPPGGNSIYYL